jgi:hypothetical protein
MKYFVLSAMRASVSHSHRSPEDVQQLKELLAWYKIRDMLFGRNWVKQDVKKALELAAVCQHPDAVWLTNLFAGRDVNTKEEARQVFLGCEGDARALCFASLLGGSVSGISRAADLGDAYAQARMAWRTNGEESFRWAEKSAAQGERDGLYMLGFCYREGQGCEKDVETAKENLLIASELGYVYAMILLGVLFGKTDPQRSHWLGKAGASGKSVPFLNEMEEQIRIFNSGTGHANIVFAIGRALKGHIDKEKREIFGKGKDFDSYIGLAKHALHFYIFQLQSYRKAVDGWTLVGIRWNVVKDIRKVIGKMIWDAREEAKYELACEEVDRNCVNLESCSDEQDSNEEQEETQVIK